MVAESVAQRRRGDEEKRRGEQWNSYGIIICDGHEAGDGDAQGRIIQSKCIITSANSEWLKGQ